MSGTVARWRMLLAAAGLMAAPAAWAVNMQLGEILPYASCSARFPHLAVTSAAAAAVALAGGALSWTRPWTTPTGRFVSALGVLTCLTFLFALLAQLAAALMLTGCEA